MTNVSEINNAAQKEWKAKTIEYAQSINAFVSKGLQYGWDNAGPEPKDNEREHLTPHLMQAIKAANKTKNFETLREEWPLAHGPLIPLLEKSGQSIPEVCILENGTIIAKIGTNYQDGYVVQITGDEVERVDGIEYFGKCPNKKYFAVDTPAGIKVTEGWLGNEVSICPYPTGLENVPDGFSLKPFETPPKPSKLIPFPDGKKVLFIASEGIYVLDPNKAHKLLPTQEQLSEHFNWLKEEYPDDDLDYELSMEHGAISRSGELIAIGAQDSSHMIFDKNYMEVGDVGNRSEYPHFALFNTAGDEIAFNSCHFYNGITIGFSTRLLPGFFSSAYEDSPDVPIIQDGARVYAGVHREAEYIIGDANGYIRSISSTGENNWQHFVGSTIGDIDISQDKKTLVCSTYAGFISIVKLDHGSSAPYEIGNGGHHEKRRWVFWKSESKPLVW